MIIREINNTSVFNFLGLNKVKMSHKSVMSWQSWSVILVVLVTILVPRDCLTRPQNPSGSSKFRRVINNSYHPQRISNSQIDHQVLSKLISNSLKFFHFDKCTSTQISSDDDCFRLSQLSRSEIAVYIGWDKRANFGVNNNNRNNTDYHRGKSANSNGNNGNNYSNNGRKVYAILPDSNSAKASGAHDIVLALDPSPTASFGHLVALFYIDFGLDEKTCGEDHQLFTSDEVCITVGKKPRCPNLLERFTGGVQPKRCHVDFLPTVYPADRVNTPPMGQAKFDTRSNLDLLECMNVHGFAHCPQLRSLEDTSKVLCDHSESNSKRCDTSHSGLGMNCKLFQTCDKAVLIGGGWNRHHSGSQSLQNILTMETFLKNNGFFVDNIRTFFANGKSTKKISIDGITIAHGHQKVGRRSFRTEDGDYLSSAMKTGLRGHIKAVCETNFCAESFFIYLNNPTTFEGDMLLWDVDYNGMADELEVYTIKELISDLSDCKANRVIILADQSNTDILMASLKTSSNHKNVSLLTAGLPNQIPTNGELTKNWVNFAGPINCLNDVAETISSHMKDSNSVIFDPINKFISSTSFIGAPCDLNPPVSTEELESKYKGCQNVPSYTWFSYDFEENGEQEDEDPASEENRQIQAFETFTSINDDNLQIKKTQKRKDSNST